jgi:hypothetical protein
VKRLVVTLLALFILSPVATLRAQDATDPDIAALAAQVASVDSERLLMRLNTPLPAELLPASFTDPQPLGAQLLSEQRAHFDETLEDISGSAIYTVDYTPASVTASPSPQATASPAASRMPRGPHTVFTSATLSYLLFDAPVDLETLEAFGRNIQAALGTEAQAGTFEEVTVNDAPALLVSTVTLVNALEFHTEWIAIPVGNVVVIAMITEGSDTFDETRFRADNEALAIAGVAYLDQIVQEMGAA